MINFRRIKPCKLIDYLSFTCILPIFQRWIGCPGWVDSNVGMTHETRSLITLSQSVNDVDSIILNVKYAHSFRMFYSVYVYFAEIILSVLSDFMCSRYFCTSRLLFGITTTALVPVKKSWGIRVIRSTNPTNRELCTYFMWYVMWFCFLNFSGRYLFNK